MSTCRKCRYYITKNHPESCLLARGFLGIEMIKKGLVGECEEFKSMEPTCKGG